MATLERTMTGSTSSSTESGSDASSPLLASSSGTTAASSPLLTSKPLFDLGISLTNDTHWHPFSDATSVQTPACQEIQDCFYYHDENASQVSLASVSSSVLSFYRVATPNSSPFASVDCNLHLTKKVDLPYCIADLQHSAFWEHDWSSLSQVRQEKARLIALMPPLERYSQALSAASQSTEALQVSPAEDDTIKIPTIQTTQDKANSHHREHAQVLLPKRKRNFSPIRSLTMTPKALSRLVNLTRSPFRRSRTLST